jgi:tRNA A37 threonylcarbamoyladenosine modification protein TsaB
MLLLSLDTTTRAASCAVARDGVVLNEEPIDPTRQLALQLPGALRDILDLSAIALEEVDAFAVANRTRIVHRSSDRHRHHAGAGIRTR